MVRYQQGRLIGHMEGLGFSLREEAVLNTLTEDVLKTSEIEGEILNAEKVRSSIARRLGMDIGARTSPDRDVEGIVETMLDATGKYDEPLTKERVFAWHAALFRTGFSGLSRITVAAWRNDSHGPMQVVSGPMGRERVHYQAPPASKLERDMTAFLEWFNDKAAIDPVIKAALAHLWFAIIHPFDDGNGRIARAIADMALARSEGSSERFYSMSAKIKLERKTYYSVLENLQNETMDVTPWVDWFLRCLGRAITGAQDVLASVLNKAKFWESASQIPLNDRQRLILNKLLNGFEGKLTSDKYAKIAKCSQDTAYRDILALVAHGILVRNAEKGRSTSYSLVIPA
jgi:Fic family protein